jgi:hypothetical protein
MLDDHIIHSQNIDLDRLCSVIVSGPKRPPVQSRCLVRKVHSVGARDTLVHTILMLIPKS